MVVLCQCPDGHPRGLCAFPPAASQALTNSCLSPAALASAHLLSSLDSFSLFPLLGFPFSPLFQLLSPSSCVVTSPTSSI